MADNNLAEMESSLRSLGAQADSSPEGGNLSIPDETMESSPVTAEPSETPDATTEEQSQQPAEVAKQSKTESAETVAEKSKTEKPAEKPLTEYEKAKQRQNKQWQEIQAEKERLKAERAEIERAKAATSTPVNPQYKAGDYETAAENAERMAKEAELTDPDAADEHRNAAKEFRQAAQTMRQREAEFEFRRIFAETAKEKGLHDDLKNPESEAGKALMELMKSHPEFGQYPNGARHAIEMLVAQRDAATVPALKEQIQKLTKEKDALAAKLTVPRTGPTARAQDTDENDLSESAVRRLGETLDTQAA